MTAFNVIQKRRRAKIDEEKRQKFGDPKTGKLKRKVPRVTISGKRQRKLLKKMKRDQKEALEQGLLTMRDVEMATADGTSQDDNQKAQMKFHVKKNSKLRIKRLKGKGKNKKMSAKSPKDASEADAMVE